MTNGVYVSVVGTVKEYQGKLRARRVGRALS